MNRIVPRGMFLHDGEDKFVVKGFSYGPFVPNANGEPLPDPRAVERDFAIMAELGANSVRVYHVPPLWFAEIAARFNLRLMVGVPWQQHIRFLDDRTTPKSIRERVADAAHRLGGGKAPMLSVLIGNEIPPQVVRWYGPTKVERFLNELYDTVKQIDPDLLVSYANFPSTEYLECEFLDYVSFNVYLHRENDFRNYVCRLQNLASFRPVVISEFGMDSIREGEEHQAELIDHTLRAGWEMGLAGAVVFAFTDEWFTGGYDVTDWAFGAVRRDRSLKPAAEAVRKLFTCRVPPPPDPAPKVSLVICAYNAERTLRECLESLWRITYPNYEVIIVDDGSTDRTKAIAQEYPEFKLISHENRGLSVARNEGALAGTGDIVAYTDSDCAVDPDWLTYHVHQLLRGGWAAVGGPNLPPPEDDWVTEAVARAPGGPTHILLTDREAEHIPGCNMMFWKKHLVGVGLFDAAFTAAGDDVDLCWRLQNQGHKIGYTPAALVWHRRRSTVNAYLKQQRGYGLAEGMLYFKHPLRFNRLGQSRWLGRIYSDLGTGILSRRPIIYSGPFGAGLFQTLYEPPAGLLAYLPASLEWNVAWMMLLVLSIAGYVQGEPLPMLLSSGLALAGISIGQALKVGFTADVSGLPPLRARLLIAYLNYMGPLVRGIARHKYRTKRLAGVDQISWPSPRQKPSIDLRGRRLTVWYWDETGIEKEEILGRVAWFLRLRKYFVVEDNGWNPWDLRVYRGVWTRGEVRVLVENHGGLKRQVDVEVRLHTSGWAKLVLALFPLGVGLAAMVHDWRTALVAGIASFAAAVFIAAEEFELGRELFRVMEVVAAQIPLLPPPRFGREPRSNHVRSAEPAANPA